ncbi:hypothetical protein ACFSTH_12475 [Paenibacillus yanchengensis]
MKKWLAAFFFLSLNQIGVNALQLHLLLKITYKTAWALHRKIRQAISQADSFDLIGKSIKPFDSASRDTTISNKKVINEEVLDEKMNEKNSVLDSLRRKRLINYSPETKEWKENKCDDAIRKRANNSKIIKLDQANPQLCGIMFERAPQEKPIMVGFELQHCNKTSSRFASHVTSVVVQVKLKLIPSAQMTHDSIVNTSYVHDFKQQHFSNQLPTSQIIHSPRIAYRQKRAVQKTFDSIMQRFLQTYGTIRNKYLQYYYDEMCFYYAASIHQRSIFHQLSLLSMTYQLRSH